MNILPITVLEVGVYLIAHKKCDRWKHALYNFLAYDALQKNCTGCTTF
jgi:hypothetical protein